MADGETIWLGHFVDMIGGNQAPSSRHVLHDNGGITGDMLAYMAGKGPRVSIKASSGRKAHNNT